MIKQNEAEDFKKAHEYFKKVFLKKKKENPKIQYFPDINKLVIRTLNFISDFIPDRGKKNV